MSKDSHIQRKEAYIPIQIDFFFPSLLTVFFSFFSLFLFHWFIPLHTIGGDCVDNDLYSAFLFFFFFALSFSHRYVHWTLISINRSASCISTKRHEHFFFIRCHYCRIIYQLLLVKWFSIWICYVVQRGNQQQRQNQKRRSIGE